jgi:hypothetical protein
MMPLIRVFSISQLANSEFKCSQSKSDMELFGPTTVRCTTANKRQNAHSKRSRKAINQFVTQANGIEKSWQISLETDPAWIAYADDAVWAETGLCGSNGQSDENITWMTALFAAGMSAVHC